MTGQYDVIIASSANAIQSLLDLNKLAPGGFVLAVLKPTEAEENDTKLDLPQCKSSRPMLVAE